MVSNDDRGNAKSAMFHNFHHFPSTVHQFNLQMDLSELFNLCFSSLRRRVVWVSPPSWGLSSSSIFCRATIIQSDWKIMICGNPPRIHRLKYFNLKRISSKEDLRDSCDDWLLDKFFCSFWPATHKILSYLKQHTKWRSFIKWYDTHFSSSFAPSSPSTGLSVFSTASAILIRTNPLLVLVFQKWNK